ncbi:MAG TPA: hypothetical protein VE641_04670 [Chthoniobacterales bacterium]|nr:hypothetical protein [Chthoniobacterales bacterium]
MKQLDSLTAGISWRPAATIALASVLLLPAASIAQQYQQTILLSDTQTEGSYSPDPQLKNP